MKVVIFGATGMVGKGVLLECNIGRAMIRVAAEGAPTPIIDTRDINRLAAA